MAQPTSEDFEYRWQLFVRELALAASGGTLPVDLTALPGELVAAGEGPRLRAITAPLLAALRDLATLLAPAPVGPRHHALAATLSAVEATGLALGPSLADLRTRWQARPRRPHRGFKLDALAPFTAPRRRSPTR